MKSLISHAIETGDEKAGAGVDVSKQLHLRQRKPRGAGDAEARGFIFHEPWVLRGRNFKNVLGVSATHWGCDRAS